MAFKFGQRVEVVSKQEGFLGSYFPAKVIDEQPDGSYLVEYKTRLKEDKSGPLVEKVNFDEVRPWPRRIPATGFGLNEYVDAYDNDGWWVGRVVDIVEGEYSVYFEISMVKEKYPLKRLRTHLEWCHGDWWFVRPSTASLSEPAQVSGGRQSSVAV